MFFFSFNFLNKIIYLKINSYYLNRISNETNTIRIYVINIKEGTALYFNKSDIRHKKSIPLTDFYSLFHINDQEKIKDKVLLFTTKHPEIALNNSLKHFELTEKETYEMNNSNNNS